MFQQDYDGESIHGDFTLETRTPQDAQPFLAGVNRTAHEPGLAQSPWNGAQPPTAANTSYLHGNLIGTNEVMTDAAGTVMRRAVFTAFGEPVYENGTTDSRYGYAGAWGYQEAGSGDPLADLGWLHVGARYYDPSAGRFMQRDPIGIRGGRNVYAYVANRPPNSVDPAGLDPIDDVDNFIDAVINGKPLGVGSAGVTVAGAANFKWKLGIGTAVNRSGVTCAGLYLGWNAGKVIVNNTSIDEGLGYVIFVIFYADPPSSGPELPLPPGKYVDIQCLVADTPVVDERGLTSIESIGIGSRVAVGDSARVDEPYCSVTALHSSLASELYHILLPLEEICATPEHPFWVVRRGWVNACELREGDQLLDIEGREVPVIHVVEESVAVPVRVYNLTIAGRHIFYVGKSRVLTHNKSC